MGSYTIDVNHGRGAGGGGGGGEGVQWKVDKLIKIVIFPIQGWGGGKNRKNRLTSIVNDPCEISEQIQYIGENLSHVHT